MPSDTNQDDFDALMEEYVELKSIEDAETGADRELDYQGTDEFYLPEEEIRAYVLKHSPTKRG